MSDIKFKLVDGEPVCTGDLCPQYYCERMTWDSDYRCRLYHFSACKDMPCIPGIRQQRDALREDTERYRNACVSMAETIASDMRYKLNRDNYTAKGVLDGYGVVDALDDESEKDGKR